ncbi:DUF159-domain-containing protein [Peniophora sp. CONT]|nr:DUF159-domain-containing protein [Peniophora sp. CONT]
MCGRFSLGLAADELEQLDGYPNLQSQVGDWVNRDAFVPRYNVAPRSQAPVIHRRAPAGESSTSTSRSEDTGKPLVLHTMKWGLVPHWSKKEDTSLSTINARAESLCESGSSGIWGSIKGKRRCVVPAQGYYEWLKKGKERLPHFTKYKDGKLVLFAGLYDIAHIEGREEPLYTFTIITTAAPKGFDWLHDRQPVILDSSASIDSWLDTSTEGWNKHLAHLLDSLPNATEKLDCYAVPKEVGKVGNESPSFIVPVEKRRDGLEAMFSKQAKSGVEGVGKRKRGEEEDEPERKPLKAPKKEDDCEVEVVSPPRSQTKALRSSQERSPKKSSPRKGVKKEETGASPKITSFFGKKS